MAKGKITPYEVSSVSPAAVGVAPQNKSGAILAQGIMTVGEALKQREDAVSDLTALSKFGDFKVSYEEQKLQLQKQYLNEPQKYPGALKELSAKMADEASSKMDFQVATKFRKYATSLAVSDADNASLWAAQRDKEIQVDSIKNVYGNLTLDAAKAASPDQLRDILGKFDVASTMARKFLQPGEDEKLRKGYIDSAKAESLMAQINTRPAKVLRDLNNGLYSDLLTPTEIAEFKGKARQADINMYFDQQARQAFSAQTDIFDLQDKVDRGEMPLAELVALQQTVRFNRDLKDSKGNPVYSPEFLQSLDNVVSQQSNLLVKVLDPVKNKPTERMELFKAWDEYIASKQSGSQSPEDIRKALQIYSKLSDAYGKGWITQAEFSEHYRALRLQNNLKQGKAQRVLALDEGLSKAGATPGFRWPWENTAGDVVPYGFREIAKFVDSKHPNLSVEERRDMKIQYMAAYNDAIERVDPAKLKALRTPAQQMAFVTNLLQGVQNPSGIRMGGILPRDLVPGKIVTGPNNVRGLVMPDGNIKVLPND